MKVIYKFKNRFSKKIQSNQIVLILSLYIIFPANSQIRFNSTKDEREVQSLRRLQTIEDNVKKQTEYLKEISKSPEQRAEEKKLKDAREATTSAGGYEWLDNYEKEQKKLAKEERKKFEKLREKSINEQIEKSVKMNEATVEFWFAQLNNGSAVAAFELAEMYLSGKNVKFNIKSAIDLYKIGSQRGDNQCKNKLIEIFNPSGIIGLNKDLDNNKKEYVESLTNQLNNGSEVAAFIIGTHYLKGDIVKTNRAEALRLIKLSADYGYPFAIERLQQFDGN